MSEAKNDEVDEILEQLHEKLLIGWIKNDGKVHTLPSHMNNDGCTDDAKAAINHLIARKEKEAAITESRYWHQYLPLMRAEQKYHIEERIRELEQELKSKQGK